MPQIQPIDLVAPGSFGLNTEKGSALLRPQWATVAQNAVINRNGRIASREGFALSTKTTISAGKQIDTLFEHYTGVDDVTIITCADNKIYKGIADYTIAGNNISPSTTPTGDDWKFVNFTGKCVGVQRGHDPIVRTGGTFADIVFTGDFPVKPYDALAAFGRVWFVDQDRQTIRISSLLDETDHTVASGAEFINMTSVWTTGIDEIVAITALGANLIVFGRNHIVMWADKRGTELGLDPASLEVVDTIEGTGCIARDSVVATGEGDLVFLSRHGLQSLGRVIQSKSNPIVSVTKNIRKEFQDVVVAQKRGDEFLDGIRSTYNPERGFYIINFPHAQKMYVLDTVHPFKDDEGEPAVPVTLWQMGGTPGGLVSLRDGRILFGSTGIVGRYEGFIDNAATYTFDFFTGWLDFGQLNHRLKMLKELVGVITAGQGDVLFRWEWDFSGTIESRTVTYATVASSQYNLLGSGTNRGEWGEGEFSGGSLLTRTTVPAHGEGQFIRVGVNATISGFEVVVQQTSLAPKIGRMVT